MRNVLKETLFDFDKIKAVRCNFPVSIATSPHNTKSENIEHRAPVLRILTATGLFQIGVFYLFSSLLISMLGPTFLLGLNCMKVKRVFGHRFQCAVHDVPVRVLALCVNDAC